MNHNELEAIARAMVARGHGILAADESSGTIKKRFDAIKLESTEESRRSYRELLFTAPGLAEHIGGVILFDETLRQKTADGVPFAEVLARQGIVPGIKVDKGAKPLPGFPGDTITEGLDGLRERLAEYHAARCPVREMARRDRYRRRDPESLYDRCQRPRARALRGAVPGSEHRADRRARSADGR